MNLPSILRTVVLMISGGAALLGILVMAGVLVPPNVPQQFHIIIGALIFLYGTYRFVVAFFRQRQ
jgi:hypothetical protein